MDTDPREGVGARRNQPHFGLIITAGFDTQSSVHTLRGTRQHEKSSVGFLYIPSLFNHSLTHALSHALIHSLPRSPFTMPNVRRPFRAPSFIDLFRWLYHPPRASLHFATGSVVGARPIAPTTTTTSFFHFLPRMYAHFSVAISHFSSPSASASSIHRFVVVVAISRFLTLR